jgi:TatD DNase family protein
MLIDTHCHLDRYPHPDKIARDAERAGVVVIAMTNLPSHFQRGRGPVVSLRNVRLSLGLHPMLAPHSEAEMRMFAEMLPVTSFIGEVGLDFTREGLRTEEAQRRAFDFVLQQIRGKGKIVSIHSRKAEDAVLEGLQKHGIKAAIFHWFTGSSLSLRAIITDGHFLSVNSAMVRSEKGRSQIRGLPLTRVLLETDGPYCRIGSKPAQPKDVLLVVQQLAELWRIPPGEVVRRTSENFRSVLRLSESEENWGDRGSA